MRFRTCVKLGTCACFVCVLRARTTRHVYTYHLIYFYGVLFRYFSHIRFKIMALRVVVVSFSGLKRMDSIYTQKHSAALTHAIAIKIKYWRKMFPALNRTICNSRYCAHTECDSCEFLMRPEWNGSHKFRMHRWARVERMTWFIALMWMFLLLFMIKYCHFIVIRNLRRAFD